MNEEHTTNESESRSVVYKANVVENRCDRQMGMKSTAQQGVEHFTTECCWNDIIYIIPVIGLYLVVCKAHEITCEYYLNREFGILVLFNQCKLAKFKKNKTQTNKETCYNEMLGMTLFGMYLLGTVKRNVNAFIRNKYSGKPKVRETKQ